MKNVLMTDALESAMFRETALARGSDLTREERFEALVRTHTRFLFRVGFAALRNVHDAEDVAQETFLKIYRSGMSGQMQDERAFLARAAWRVAMSLRKRRNPGQLSENMPDVGANPEHAAIDADSEAMLHRMIDALPEKLRQPLALSAIGELDSAAIARILSIPESTVRGRILQARVLLKRKLAAQMEKRQ